MAEHHARLCSLLQKLDLESYDAEDDAVTESEEGILDKIVKEIHSGLEHTSFWDELANRKISPQSLVAFCAHMLSGSSPFFSEN